MIVVLKNSSKNQTARIVSFGGSFSVWGGGQTYFEYYYTAIAC